MTKYSDEPIGTPKAHYAGPKSGPFRCSICVHFRAQGSNCDHPDVKADADAGHIEKDEAGRPVVAPAGCCNYFR